jgi:hypothetical protein
VLSTANKSFCIICIPFAAVEHIYAQARIATATLRQDAKSQSSASAFAITDGKNKTEASGRVVRQEENRAQRFLHNT